MYLHRFGVLITLVILPAFAQVYNAPISPRNIPHRYGPVRNLQTHPDGSGTSDSWSGYILTAATGSVTDVKGSWLVPEVSCPASGTTESGFWVGIDFGDTSTNQTLEQTGTASNCVDGTPVYRAWYEFLPCLSVLQRRSVVFQQYIRD